MTRRYRELTFTDSVRRVQQRLGAREAGGRIEARPVDEDRLGDREIEFVTARDGFYMASVGEGGWPYVQFRGGPVGFLKVLDPRTLAFADFRGNRQYISTGNLEHDARASLFLMDYPNRQRLKIMATAEVLESGAEHDGLIDRLHDAETYDATVERVILLHVEAYDWNCPQHITPRYTLDELADAARSDRMA